MADYNKDTTFKFHIMGNREKPPANGKNCGYLTIDNWNGYSYVTMFDFSLHDKRGKFHQIGAIKIAFMDQSTEQTTHSTLDKTFEKLPNNYFSLAVDVDFYQNLRTCFDNEFFLTILSSLCDVALDEELHNRIKEQDVFQTSLMRSVREKTILTQYRRVISGGDALTDYSFKFYREASDRFSEINLYFQVKAASKPSTNIHAIIGRNGVGKTTFLNHIVESTISGDLEKGYIYDTSNSEKISLDYFSNTITVSFSAFDPFRPPPNQQNPEKGSCYSYIGLKDNKDINSQLYPNEESNKLKASIQLENEFIKALEQCLLDTNRKARWQKSISTLRSDPNFADMEFHQIIERDSKEALIYARELFKRMSSGHAVVVLILTNLVAKVTEKTLILLDEPESHLHPPLLSALIRTLSDLLYERNGVAIIATHSPVVLQEIPKACVWKLTRSHLALESTRPSLETFGENVGILTREVFGLEVDKSGFTTLLKKQVDENKTYQEILDVFSGQLGFEGRAILQAMIINRDNEKN